MQPTTSAGMANTLTPERGHNTLTPLPPAPAYIKSSPPPALGQQEFPRPPLRPSPPLLNEKLKLMLTAVPKRKPIELAALEVSHNAVIHNSPISPVVIDNSCSLPEAASAQIEDVRTLSQDSWQKEESTLKESVKTPLTQRGSSLSSTTYTLPSHQAPCRHMPSNSVSESPRIVPERRDSLHYDQSQQMPYNIAQNSSQGSSSRGSIESLPQENEVYQPLQYHHQTYEEGGLDRNGNRGSKRTLRSASDSSSGGEPGPGVYSHGEYLTPTRAPHLGLGIQRPVSAYSSMSDLAARGRSPNLSPHVHARAVSAHSTASPDTRPLSFVDLLNVPYPQAPPGPKTLSHDHLRPSVGNNASLLSHKQTFDMYLANVKKTNDPGAQFEFAVFMINASQKQEDDQNSTDSPRPEKSEDISRADLLREAKNILQRLSDRSYPYAQYYLADGLASGLFNKGKKDDDKAFPYFIAASKHGHAEAGYRAALCYEFGLGSRQDGAKAVQFYRQAASKNHPGAMLRLGKACLNGEMGLVKRYREGITWLKRAAESADRQYNSAPYELGLLHETGYGDDVFQDETYSAQLFTKSAELGHAEAAYRMGDAYEHGRLNCPVDPALSVHFYTCASQQGHALAMMALCAWFMVGAEPLLSKDECEAYEWARRAAELGLPKAEYAVGYFTEMGIGCRRDPLEANVWYVKAADHGDERAKQRIAAIRAAASGADPSMASKRGRGKGRQPNESPGKQIA
ncbi:hypothetical protein PABG_00201 [Paracoccidioides brasiliensis Pb03]|uniref:Uncharacterized protein n=1 Tax=Paracoccidioides brasiliensis (strain Pb18) TaxID=502780 RepID=C1G5Z6_PARBD|nr:uncharacterized protein PADG_02601 [Paracoccidioides brasiliensis Pb18]EEH17638.2 hypothetical protein PABG_00201 [Paracoccidioides brasiliensis Pb03]EEH46503.2 hypothetical protein PADG_02601 [Paracoccidioides brasiliensis Pb18]